MSSVLKFSSQSNPKTQLSSVKGVKGQERGTSLPSNWGMSSAPSFDLLQDAHELCSRWRAAPRVEGLLRRRVSLLWDSGLGQPAIASVLSSYLCMLAGHTGYSPPGKACASVSPSVKGGYGASITPPHLLKNLNQNHASGMKRNDLIALANYISMLFSHCLQQPGNHFACYHILLSWFQLWGPIPTFEDQPKKQGDSSRTEALVWSGYRQHFPCEPQEMLYGEDGAAGDRISLSRSTKSR